MTTSAPAAASRGRGRHRAGMARPRTPWRGRPVRFQTVSWWALARWTAIGVPMAPRPRKAMRIVRSDVG